MPDWPFNFHLESHDQEQCSAHVGLVRRTVCTSRVKVNTQENVQGILTFQTIFKWERQEQKVVEKCYKEWEKETKRKEGGTKCDGI